MKTKLTALLLALALCVTPAAAQETVNPSAGESTEAAAPETTEPGEASNEEEETGEASGEEGEAGETEETEPEAIPDAEGTVSFGNLASRMHENNLQLLQIEESVQIVKEIDYEDLYKDLREQMNSIAKMQWTLLITPSEYLGGDYQRDKSYDQLDASYDAVRDQFEAIEDGEMQADNEGVLHQLTTLQDQIVMAGESLYIALTGLEIQEAGLQRQLAAMNRTVAEMELRYQLGQISALQLAQVQAGRSSLSSGLETLQMNIRNYKTQLEVLLGTEQSGAIRLLGLPQVTEEQLSAMNLEQDLETAKANSYELYDAEQTLEDARETLKEDRKTYGYDEKDYNVRRIEHNWQAAQYAHEIAFQDYELRFRTLYAQVHDCKQILDASYVTLNSQRLDYEATALKYQQGTISQNALAQAQDALTESEDAVKTAANNLFSTYNTYRWAVDKGILN